MELGPTCPHSPSSSHDMGASRRPAAAWFCVSTEKPGTAGDAGERPAWQAPKDGVPHSQHDGGNGRAQVARQPGVGGLLLGAWLVLQVLGRPGGSARGNLRTREPSSRNLSPGRHAFGESSEFAPARRTCLVLCHQ